jgi:hypothetical protein
MFTRSPDCPGLDVTITRHGRHAVVSTLWIMRTGDDLLVLHYVPEAA